MKNKIRNWLYKFMYGRNGVDTLGKDLFYVVIFFIILNLFLKGYARLIVILILECFRKILVREEMKLINMKARRIISSSV